jgi:RNA polymerase sigma-70 factor, ECF subfamily
MEGGDGPDQSGADDDIVLVRRTLSGDQGAFEVLVRRYERLVFWVVRSVLGGRGDVEDVAQEAFIRAFRGLAGFRQSGRMAPWIARIATTASLDRLRQQHRSAEVGWDDLSESQRRAAGAMAAAEEPGEAVEARDLAERALSRLRPLDRALVILVDGHGFAPAEAARMIGSTATAARVKLHRARRTVRRVAEALLEASGRIAGEDQDD